MSAKRLFVQVVGWVGGLCLLGTLLFFAAQQFDLAGPARDILLDVAGIDPSPVGDPCLQNDTAGAIVARIDYNDAQALHTLFERVDVWHVDPEQHTAVALVSPAQQQWLTDGGFPFSEETQLTADLPDPCAFQTLADSNAIPGYACYRTVTKTYSDLESLAEQYPDLAELNDIGNSWYKIRSWGLAGADIQALVLTNRQSTDFEKGELVVMAAQHPRELATAEVATRFADMLLEGYGTDPDLTWLLDYNRIHIIPQANPDGRSWVEQGYLWRKNTNSTNGCEFPRSGVDLNRNGSFLWNHCQGCSSSDICSVFYRGESAASEPETRAIETYLSTVFADQRGEGYNDPAPEDTNGIFISLHSFGRLLFYPWEHSSTPAPNREELRRLGRKLGYFPDYRVCNPELCMYRFDGSTTDYAYGTLGVAAYTYELGTAFFQSCTYFGESIANQILESLVYAAKAARRPYQLPAGPDVTDASADPPRMLAGMTVTLSATADDTRSAGSGSDTEPSQPISAARFSIDAPSWLATTFETLQPSDGAFDATVESLTGALDSTGLQPGSYTIFLEAQDEDGNWGPPTAVSIEVVAPATERTPVQHKLYLPRVWR